MDTLKEKNDQSIIDQQQYIDHFLIFDDGVVKNYKYNFQEISSNNQFTYQIDHQEINLGKTEFLKNIVNMDEEGKKVDKSYIKLVSLIHIIFQNYLFSNDQKTANYFTQYIKYIQSVFYNYKTIVQYQNMNDIQKLFKKIQKRTEKNKEYLVQKQKQLQNYISDLNLLMQKNILSLVHLYNLMSQPNQFIKYQMVALQNYIFKKVENKIKLSQFLDLFKQKFNVNILKNSQQNHKQQNIQQLMDNYFRIERKSEEKHIVSYSGDMKKIINKLVENYFDSQQRDLKICDIGQQIEIDKSMIEYSKISAIQFKNPIEACQVYFFLLIIDHKVERNKYINFLEQCLNETHIYDYIDIKDSYEFNQTGNLKMKDFIKILQNPVYTSDIDKLLKLALNKYFRLLIMQFYIYLIRREQKLDLLFTKVNSYEQILSIFQVLIDNFAIESYILLQNFNLINDSNRQIYSFYINEQKGHNKQNSQFFILLPQSWFNQQQKLQINEQQQQELKQVSSQQQRPQLNELQANRQYQTSDNSNLSQKLTQKNYQTQICTNCYQNIASVFYQNLIVCDPCLLIKFVSYI
ncbi:hypothetical protein ABPG74_021942 [Tetrahymena malaccensis]